MLTALDEADLAEVTPQLRELTVPTLLVWGTGDSFFDVSWAYWLRDTIPGTTRVVTVDGARLFFPDERPMDLGPHLEQHWAESAAVRARPAARSALWRTPPARRGRRGPADDGGLPDDLV